MDHPVCNFAGRVRLDPWVANQLVEIAIERRAFNVYSAPGNSPDSRELRDEILVRAGFQRSYCLQQMLWDSKQAQGRIDLQLAETASERREVANFMSNQFFSRHSIIFRRSVADATVHASRLDLYTIRQRGDIVAALMIAEDANVSGLFNLCVKPHEQSRGWGTAIVAEVCGRAYDNGRVVCLQCDETLAPWYERQGFVRSGWVDVYGLSDERRIAIIN
ncbi:MAG: GNAT family N-acetyltransferase [Chlorobia bacterium]|nr:GNAT family N-acetyltransferase [Fimbriimonadaceae bacterium]